MVKLHQSFSKTLKNLEATETECLKNIERSNSDGLAILKDFVKMRWSAEEAYISSLKKFENVGLKFLADSDSKKAKGTNDTLLKRFLSILLSTVTCRIKCVQQYVKSTQHSYLKIIENLETLNEEVFNILENQLDKSFQQCLDMVGDITSNFDKYSNAFEKEKAYFQKNKKYANPSNRLNPKAANKLETLQALATTSDKLRNEYHINYVAYMKLANHIKDEQVPQFFSLLSNTFDPYFFAFMDLFFRNEKKFSKSLSEQIDEIYKSIDIRNDQELYRDMWLQACAPYEKQFTQSVEILASDSVMNLRKSGMSELETKQLLEQYAESLSSNQWESTKYLSHSRELFLAWKDYCKEVSKVEPGVQIMDIRQNLSKFTLFVDTELWVAKQKAVAVNSAKVHVLNNIVNGNRDDSKRLRSCCFGINLSRYCQEMGVKLPNTVVMMMTYIAKHGKDSIDIFKQPSTEVDIHKLRNRLDDGKTILSNTDVYVVANVFKIYLAELRNFIPRIGLDNLLASLSNQSNKNKIESCANFINGMDSYSSRLLMNILTFLKMFTDNSQVNRMSISVLSSILAKPLFHLEAVEETSIVRKPYENILAFMIQNSERLVRRKVSSKTRVAPQSHNQKMSQLQRTSSNQSTGAYSSEGKRMPQIHSYEYVQDDDNMKRSADDEINDYEDDEGQAYYDRYEGNTQSNRYAEFYSDDGGENTES